MVEPSDAQRRGESHDGLERPRVPESPEARPLPRDEALWQVDERGFLSYVDGRFSELLATPVGELLGRRVLDFVDEGGRDALVACRERGGVVDLKLRGRGGAPFWAMVQVTPLNDAQGLHRGCIGHVTALGGPDSRERALRESEERFRTLVENVPGVVYLCRNDERFSMLYISRAIESLVGIPVAEFLEDRVSLGELMHPEDVEKVRRLVNAALLEKRQYVLEYRLRGASGTWLHIEEHGQGVFDEWGALRYLEGTLIDVTSRRQSEEERRQFGECLERSRKLESLAALAGGVAHDFNNLLVGVIGYADLALESVEESHPGREMMRRIRASALRATELTDQLLAYSGRGRFIVRAHDLNELLRSYLAALRTTAPGEVALRHELGERLPPIQADRTQLSQLVANLVSNAWESLEGRAGVVTLRSRAERLSPAQLGNLETASELDPGEYVVLEVEDNGPGIPSGLRRRIFDPFFTTKLTGRGLGLAAVLGIVRGHGAGIEVLSEKERGTRVRVCFPVAAQDGFEPRLPPSALTTLAGRTVLVVDDDEGVRSVAQLALTGAGVEVLLASHGQEALELFASRPSEVDLVVLDLSMPGIGGRDVCGAVHRLNPRARILLSSGFDEGVATVDFGPAELIGFLKKPYSPAELLERVTRSLGEEE